MYLTRTILWKTPDISWQWSSKSCIPSYCYQCFYHTPPLPFLLVSPPHQPTLLTCWALVWEMDLRNVSYWAPRLYFPPFSKTNMATWNLTWKAPVLYKSYNLHPCYRPALRAMQHVGECWPLSYSNCSKTEELGQRKSDGHVHIVQIHNSDISICMFRIFCFRHGWILLASEISEKFTLTPVNQNIRIKWNIA